MQTNMKNPTTVNKHKAVYKNNKPKSVNSHKSHNYNKNNNFYAVSKNNKKHIKHKNFYFNKSKKYTPRQLRRLKYSKSYWRDRVIDFKDKKFRLLRLIRKLKKRKWQNLYNKNNKTVKYTFNSDGLPIIRGFRTSVLQCYWFKRPVWLCKRFTLPEHYLNHLRARKYLIWLEFLKWTHFSQKYRRLSEDFYNTQSLYWKFKRKNLRRFLRLSRWYSKVTKWQIPLIVRQKLYKNYGFSQYQQAKHPLARKKNKIYKWYNYQLFDRWKYGVKKKSFFRIKQLLTRCIVGPFYGNLKAKQFAKIKRRASRVKTIALQNSRNTVLLTHLENRLDVIVYRANFAPTIQWARVFINLKIFYVSSITRFDKKNYLFLLIKDKFPLFFNKLHKQLQKYVNPAFSSIKNKFNILLNYNTKVEPLPINKIDFLVKQHDIIHWTMNSSLKHFFFLSIFRRKRYSAFIYNKQKNFIYIYKQPRQDFFWAKDRIQEHTLNWFLL